MDVCSLDGSGQTIGCWPGQPNPSRHIFEGSSHLTSAEELWPVPALLKVKFWLSLCGSMGAFGQRRESESMHCRMMTVACFVMNQVNPAIMLLLGLDLKSAIWAAAAPA